MALSRVGLRVIRFWSREIDMNIDGAVETIIASANIGLRIIGLDEEQTDIGRL